MFNTVNHFKNNIISNINLRLYFANQLLSIKISKINRQHVSFVETSNKLQLQANYELARVDIF